MTKAGDISQRSSEVLERYQKVLVHYAAQITGEIEGARDAVQDVFVRLITKHPDILLAGGPHLEGWLFRACRNRAIDWIRKSGKIVPFDLAAAKTSASSEPTPLEALLAEDQRKEIQALVAALPVDQREVIHLKFGAGLPYREIAGITGHSISNVGFLIHKGLRALRHAMQQNTRCMELSGGRKP